MPPNTATRIGWAQYLANLQTPIGTDKFGYAWRSRKGTIFHEAAGLHYANEGYAEGDVLGFLIILPDETPANVVLPRKYKKLVRETLISSPFLNAIALLAFSQIQELHLFRRERRSPSWRSESQAD